ncbi:MAG: cation:proton antiporter [Planctomycetaceae bacterium]
MSSASFFSGRAPRYDPRATDDMCRPTTGPAIMPHLDITPLIQELLTILAAGLVAGVVCRRLGVSLLVGYLVVGAIIGRGGLEWLTSARHEREVLAEAGALLLLFSVGIEFSLGELLRLWRYVLLGGAVQMALVAGPLVMLLRTWSWNWPAAALAGFSAALSSTVLVFRALHELGQASTPHGRRGLGILLFQDIALVPLLMFLPLLTGHGQAAQGADVLRLALLAGFFVVGVWGAQRVVKRWLVPLLARLRSVEIVVLSTVCTLAGLSYLANWLGLPAAVGALAAGLVLSGNRLSPQIDSILLPFRETFSAVFFVSLGTLLRPAEFLSEPFLLLAGLIGILMLKTLAAAVALWCTGLSGRAALGMGLGLSQLGEFSFLLLAQGAASGVIDAGTYNRCLFIAIATLILTPQLLRRGISRLNLAETSLPESHEPADIAGQQAVVIGIGPIGRQVTSRLEMMGMDACLMDLSPINLQPFAQLGFRTCTGDARDPRVLERISIHTCRLAVVCVPGDDIALQIVRSLKHANRSLAIAVRCRFQASVQELEQAGASGVISEEVQASAPLVALCEQLLTMTTVSTTVTGSRR